MTEDPKDKEIARLNKKIEAIQEKSEAEVRSAKLSAAVKRRRKGIYEVIDGKVTYELAEAEKSVKCGQWGHPDGDLAWDPGPKQRIPKDGAWVMITRRLPNIERGLGRNLMVGRVFWCEHQASTDEAGFTNDGSYKVICRAPWGDVHLWPYEYSRMEIPEIIALWQEQELTFVPTNVQLARFNDIVFYARQRGIGVADAMVMALGTLKGPVGWFRPSTIGMQIDLMKMEERVHRWKPRCPRLEPMIVNLEIRP